FLFFFFFFFFFITGNSLHSRHSGDAVVGLNPGVVHTRIHRLRRGPNASGNTLVAVGIEPVTLRSLALLSYH
ncbi:hypothetical protein LINPERHAP1_LOCUS23783, partial [Linum perenne]